jgi:hypothetical protein
MTYESKREVNSVLTRSEALRGKRAFGTGYKRRDFKADPVGNLIPSFGGRVFDRKEWPELMAMQDKNQSSPLDWHRDGVEIMDQRQTNFCWCFGTVAGVATQYAKTGINTPEFSPASTACMIKGFKNEGGWGSQACNGIQRHGIATTDTWPNVSFNRQLPSLPSVREDMHQHDLIEFEDLGVNAFDEMMSVLLDPLHPAPVTGGFTWWGHLVILLKAVRYQGQWGVIFANSWGKDWGESGGYGVLLGDKAVPYESIRIGSVKPRSN